MINVLLFWIYISFLNHKKSSIFYLNQFKTLNHSISLLISLDSSLLSFSQPLLSLYLLLSLILSLLLLLTSQILLILSGYPIIFVFSSFFCLLFSSMSPRIFFISVTTVAWRRRWRGRYRWLSGWCWSLLRMILLWNVLIVLWISP